MFDKQSIQTAGGAMGVLVATPTGAPTAVIIVLQEIFGINADMRQTCGCLANRGYVAICPDLFWRLAPDVNLSDSSEHDWARALSLYARFDRDVGVDDIGEAMKWAGVRYPSSPVGIVGFCLGGLMAFRAAALLSPDVAVAYYGGGTADYLAEAGDLLSPLMMHLADDDEYMPPESQKNIRAHLERRDGLVIHSYPGCKHAFARNGGVHHSAHAADLAHERTLNFLSLYLGPGAPRPPANRGTPH